MATARCRLRRRLCGALVGVVAVVASGALAATAGAVAAPPGAGPGVVQPPEAFQAATATGGEWEFSPFIAPNPLSLAPFGQDCTAEIGPVKDPVHALLDPNFRLYGGVRVNCSSVKSVISANVVEQYCSSNAAADCSDTAPNWSDATARTSGVLSGTTGSGTAILVATPICRGTATYFRTAARIAIDQAVVDVTSDPTPLTTTGCLTGDEP